MTSPSEGGQPQPEADDQLDLSGETPTAKSYQPPLQEVLDEFSGHAVVTPYRVSLWWATKVRGDLGTVLTFLVIAIVALGAASAVAGFGRLWDAPGLVVFLLGTTAGAGTFIAGLIYCKPSIRGKRG